MIFFTFSSSCTSRVTKMRLLQQCDHSTSCLKGWIRKLNLLYSYLLLKSCKTGSRQKYHENGGVQSPFFATRYMSYKQGSQQRTGLNMPKKGPWPHRVAHGHGRRTSDSAKLLNNLCSRGLHSSVQTHSLTTANQGKHIIHLCCQKFSLMRLTHRW